MACGAAFSPDVLRRATELIEAMSVTSPGAFEAAVVDGIERLIPGAEVRFATTEETVVECEIRVERIGLTARRLVGPAW